MKNNQLTETLQGLGLTENESGVYFAALSLGPTTILRLSQAAGLKRTTVYSVVESLKQKGLMNIEVAGFKKKFSAEHPDKLESILEARRARFKELLPEFSALYNLRGGESFIRYYEGIESVKSVYESFLRDIRPHQEYLIMGNVDHWVNADEEYFTDFSFHRAKLPITIKMLVQDTGMGHKWLSLAKNFNAEARMLPTATTLTTNLVITPQRVLIHQLTQPIIGIVIENKSVIRMHQEMYGIMWNASEEN